MKTRIVLIVMLGLVGLSGRGQVTFQKLYELDTTGYGYVEANSVQQTSDGGYIITGYKIISQYKALLLIRTDSVGDTLWTKTLGGSNETIGYSAQQTSDGGFIVVGSYHNPSIGGLWLIKTDSNGQIIFSKTYNFTHFDEGYSVKQNSDGGFIMSGYIGDGGVYLIRTNGIGDTLWTKIFVDSVGDVGNHVLQTNDGGFIIAGTHNISNYLNQVYVIKTDSLGTIMWTKGYGGISGLSVGNYIQQTTDNGYIITGKTNSFTIGDYDVYLIRTDSLGSIIWSKTYGGSGYDAGSFVQQTNDGGFIVIGTCSFGTGADDYYLIKTNENGDTLFTKAIGTASKEIATSGQRTIDGGYIIVGNMDTGMTGHAIYLVKTDSLGNVSCNQSYTSTSIHSGGTFFSNPIIKLYSGSVVSTPPLNVGFRCKIADICNSSGISKTSPTSSLLLSPNPFSTQTTLTLQGTYHNPTLFIYNLLGQEIKSIHVGTNTRITINRERLPAGMYFYKLIEDNKEVLGIGKLLISE